MSSPNAWEPWLRQYVERHAGVAGTVHVVAGGAPGGVSQGEQLVLRAAFNIPPPVIEITRTIPKGKGMAGLAWERGQAVQTCNLKTDASGDVRPGARAVNAQAAVAIPVFGEGDQLRAVVGIAFAFERDLSEAELATLTQDALAVPLDS